MGFLSSMLSPIIDLIKWLVKKFKKPDPTLVLKRREKIRKEFERKLPAKNKYGIRCEAIIRDLERMDSYPEIDSKAKGISPWFKVEIKDLYHRGVEVFINRPRYIVKDAGGRWQFTDHNDKDNKFLAFPVGRIPFDLIEYVNWEGDEYYNFLHIYCKFKGRKGSPYESIPFFIKYKSSKYLSEAEGFRPWDKYKRKGFWLKKK